MLWGILLYLRTEEAFDVHVGRAEPSNWSNATSASLKRARKHAETACHIRQTSVIEMIQPCGSDADI